MMSKLNYFFLFILLCMTMTASAEDFTVVLNGETTVVSGSLSSEGEYIITPSMTYKVTGRNEAILGDMNEDGMLNVMDVTTMIDLAVDKGYATIADMNKDTNLNVLDVTSLIDAVITQNVEIIVLSYIVEEMPDEWIVGGNSYGRVEQE